MAALVAQREIVAVEPRAVGQMDRALDRKLVYLFRKPWRDGSR